jgi:Tol biopolymer transport system component
VATNGAPVVVSGAYTTDPAALGPVGFGELRATTEPAVPSTITIDGQTRNDWGLDWLQLTPGAYEVCFGDVPGFATPACEQAVVTAGTTTTVEGQFETLGLLAVSTDPPVESTISVNGVPRDDWGVWLPIAPGDHQVCFTPATTGQHPVEQCQTATVTAAQTTPVTATFGPATSSTTTRVSVASDGTQANGASGGTLPRLDNITTAISADGRYAAFHSAASNLVPGDTNDIPDVFVRDRWTGTTTRVSVASDGTQAARPLYGTASSDSPTISGDGRYIAFRSDALLLFPGDPTPSGCLCVHDLWTGTTTKVAGYGWDPQISHDGRYVTFSHWAALVPEDTNGRSDVFVYDRSTGATSLVSVAPDGTQFDLDSSDPQISGDGRYVAFTAAICLSNCGGGTPPWYPSAADSVTLPIPLETWQLFLHDRSTSTTTLVSKTPAGTRADGHSSAYGISADGRYILLGSAATNLIDDDLGIGGLLVHDQVTGTFSRVVVTHGGGSSSPPKISADGRYVVFRSRPTPDDPGYALFVHDRSTGTTTRVSVASDGTQANDRSYWPAISADGRFVTFSSSASNLVPDDTNGTSDVFVHERSTT